MTPDTNLLPGKVVPPRKWRDVAGPAIHGITPHITSSRPVPPTEEGPET
ncbi:hypothetical protein BW41_02104 [Sphingomonas sp. RIT328]|nr:hypothetical protein BW41_02104 [Sphingomonas sp. RIT328]